MTKEENLVSLAPIGLKDLYLEKISSALWEQEAWGDRVVNVYRVVRKDSCSRAFCWTPTVWDEETMVVAKIVKDGYKALETVVHYGRGLFISTTFHSIGD